MVGNVHAIDEGHVELDAEKAAAYERRIVRALECEKEIVRLEESRLFKDSTQSVLTEVSYLMHEIRTVVQVGGMSPGTKERAAAIARITQVIFGE